MDLFLREASARIGSDDVPSRIDGLMDRGSFLPILRRGLGRSGLGPQGYDPVFLLKGLPTRAESPAFGPPIDGARARRVPPCAAGCGMASCERRPAVARCGPRRNASTD